MEIQILGPLSISAISGAEVVITSIRQQKILSALILRPNRLVTTSRLIDIVWPGNPPSTARVQIQNCVGLLRRRLHFELRNVEILRRTTGYQIQVPESKLDSAIFERLCHEAEKHLASGDIKVAVAGLGQALRLWRGQVLENVDVDEFLAEKVRLEELRIKVLIQYADLSEEHDPDLISNLRSSVSAMPFHEGLTMALAKVLQRNGRVPEALDRLRELQIRTREELGLDVGSAVQEMERRLLRVEHALPAPGELDQLRELVTSATRQLNLAVQLLGKASLAA